jgi:hypothetical protein
MSSSPPERSSSITRRNSAKAIDGGVHRDKDHSKDKERDKDKEKEKDKEKGPHRKLSRSNTANPSTASSSVIDSTASVTALPSKSKSKRTIETGKEKEEPTGGGWHSAKTAVAFDLSQNVLFPLFMPFCHGSLEISPLNVDI